MKQRPPGSTRTDPLVPETTLFRSVESRYTDRTQVDSLYGLADSLSHGALVYGAGRRDNLAIDQLAQTATLYFNSAKIAEAKGRSEEHKSELQSLMRNSYAVFCLTKKQTNYIINMYN